MIQNNAYIELMKETKQLENSVSKISLRLKTDQQLIQAFLDGNKESIGILVERYQRQLYFLCLRILQDHEDSLELVQKTFIQVMEKLYTLQNHNSFKTWLYRIALNLCHNFLREKQNYNKALSHLSLESSGSFNDPVIQEEQSLLLKEFLEELTEKQRNAILLRIYHNLSYQEIAEIMDCQEVTVRSHFHLGLKKLAGKLKKCGLTL
ncbi:MAG: RNA polymerase sigma factor [Candidatus Brocadiae bacterium]|nr:RNA polymerase sigma factor [Candidatus Brocadiia bacterium]